MNKIADEYDAGMGTTPGMWEMLSDVLAEYEEKLPYSLNLAIYALRDGQAKVTPNVKGNLRGKAEAERSEAVNA